LLPFAHYAANNLTQFNYCNGNTSLGKTELNVAELCTGAVLAHYKAFNSSGQAQQCDALLVDYDLFIVMLRVMLQLPSGCIEQQSCHQMPQSRSDEVSSVHTSTCEHWHLAAACDTCTLL
jgi:hypothetical protein